MTRAPSKKIAQGNATRAALLSAARELFARDGYAATSIDDIVARAGVTKGAFYHHFGGKEELFLRVFETVKKELSRAAFMIHRDYDARGEVDGKRPPLRGEAVAAQDDEAVWSDLRTRCRRYIELHTDPAVRRIVLVDARWVATWDELQRIENDYGAVVLRADLRRAMQRGLIGRLPLRSLALILTGALDQACMLVANAEDREGMVDEAVGVVEELVDGLRRHGGSPARGG